jgi:hypothetical protein
MCCGAYYNDIAFTAISGTISTSRDAKKNKPQRNDAMRKRVRCFKAHEARCPYFFVVGAAPVGRPHNNWHIRALLAAAGIGVSIHPMTYRQSANHK